MDEEPATFAALVERIGTWDDEPGRIPYPLPRYEFPVKECLRITSEPLTAIEERHGPLPNEAVVPGVCELVEQLVPEAYKEAALARLATFPPGTQPMHLTGGDDVGPADFCVAAALAAWLYRGAGGRMLMQETLRLKLLEEVRLVESLAKGAPEREQINKISDRDALAFLTDLYGEEGEIFTRTIPAPSQRGPWEWDILSVVKTHLLETPAEATTPEQAQQLKEKILSVLQSSLATQKRKTTPTVRPVGKRTQPKRRSKRDR
ncbi:hypothetical protein [Streptomyces sp. SGAir0957]